MRAHSLELSNHENAMNTHILDVANEFSTRPFGRDRSDGDGNAESFLEEHLIPALREHAHVTVDLSGTNAYGSPFLEGAFGGLARATLRDRTILRDDKWNPEKQLQQHLEIVHASLPSVEKESWYHIISAYRRHWRAILERTVGDLERGFLHDKAWDLTEEQLNQKIQGMHAKLPPAEQAVRAYITEVCRRHWQAWQAMKEGAR
ncbi:MAG: STAS-like domain-containing protein [Gammaproteobacteria bacterium]